MVSRSGEFWYALVEEGELNELLMGNAAGHPIRWGLGEFPGQHRRGKIGVVWRRELPAGPEARPMVLVVSPEDQGRLFGRVASLRSELAPLTAWCHIVSPEAFEGLQDVERRVELTGFEAAWTGLAVAEAQLLAGRPASQLKLAACLATQTFAIGRERALWGRYSADEVLRRFDIAQRLFRGSDNSIGRLRNVLMPIWVALSEVRYVNTDSPVALAIGALAKHRRARQEGGESALLSSVFSRVVEPSLLDGFEQLGPESRLRVFDSLMAYLHSPRTQSVDERQLLAFLAGYVATVAAGGQSSISLASGVSDRFPEVLAWAYVIGSIGERVTWTSAFDGLGRLVSREMTRPFHLDEQPWCDFAVEEAAFVVDRKLADPLVHLKIKQLRVATVSILPGVDIAVTLTDQIGEPRRSFERFDDQFAKDLASKANLFDRVVELLAEYLAERASDESNRVPSGAKRGRQRSKGSKRKPDQSRLPLSED